MKKLLFFIVFGCCIVSHSICAPKISIITSVYNGDIFIKGFMDDIVQQTIFKEECELIMINANSPGHEEAIIQEYMQKYPNIIYIKLDYDPGLYAVWNMAVRLSAGEFLINANLDDRLAPNALRILSKALEQYPNIDLVYADYYFSEKANETFEQLRKGNAKPTRYSEFSVAEMKINMPANHPMWRKTLHDKHGFFDETLKIAGDKELWLRAVAGGAQFKKINKVCGVYFINPHGLSTSSKNERQMWDEERLVKKKYAYLFQKKKNKNNLK